MPTAHLYSPSLVVCSSVCMSFKECEEIDLCLDVKSPVAMTRPVLSHQQHTYICEHIIRTTCF